MQQLNESELSHVNYQFGKVVFPMQQLIDKEAYSLLLFLLVAKRFGALAFNASDDFSLYEDFSTGISNVTAHDGELRDTLKQGQIEFSNELRQIYGASRLAVYEALSSLDVYSIQFPAIFDAAIDFGNKMGRGTFYERYLPNELAEAMVYLAEVPKYGKVLFPYSGLATIALNVEQNHQAYICEGNYRTFLISKLRLIAYNSIQHCNTSAVDPLIAVGKATNFDCIIAMPPFGLRVMEPETGKTLPLEHLLLPSLDKALTRNGIAVLLLRNSFFTDNASLKIREDLVRRNLIHAVVKMPNGVFENTNLGCSILVLKNGRKPDEKVRFVSAEAAGKPSDRKALTLDVESLKETLCSEEVTGFSTWKSIQDIEQNSYKLSVDFFLQPEINGILLSDVVRLIPLEPIADTKGGKYIRIRDLSKDVNSTRLNLASVDSEVSTSVHLKQLKQSALLITLRYKELRPTWFEYTGTPIFLSNDIVALEVDTSKVLLQYVIAELWSESLMKQAEVLRTGVSIPTLSKTDLLSLKIADLPLSEQQILVNRLREERIRNITFQQTEEFGRLSIVSESFYEYASLKHMLGTPRQNILDWADNLLHFFSSHQMEMSEINAIFLAEYGRTFIQVAERIKSDVNFMSELLESGIQKESFDDMPKSILALSELSEMLGQYQGRRGKFEVTLNVDLDIEDERGVEGNVLVLKQLIENLLTNAEKHAFEREAPENRVIIQLDSEVDELFLEVKNNGLPFPARFDRDRFISKFTTSAKASGGHGIGGYDVHRAAKYFGNPDWELILDSSSAFPAVFRFRFNLKPLN